MAHFANVIGNFTKVSFQFFFLRNSDNCNIILDSPKALNAIYIKCLTQIGFLIGALNMSLAANQNAPTF